MSCKLSDTVVSPQELNFVVQEGSQFIPPYQFISLKKATHSGLPANWQASADAKWVSLSPKSGTVPKRIKTGTRSIGMPVGIYHAKLTIKSRVLVLPSPIVSINLEVKRRS